MRFRHGTFIFASAIAACLGAAPQATLQLAMTLSYRRLFNGMQAGPRDVDDADAEAACNDII